MLSRFNGWPGIPALRSHSVMSDPDMQAKIEAVWLLDKLNHPNMEKAEA
jgi:hypothetical protein